MFMNGGSDRASSQIREGEGCSACLTVKRLELHCSCRFEDLKPDEKQLRTLSSLLFLLYGRE